MEESFILTILFLWICIIIIFIIILIKLYNYNYHKNNKQNKYDKYNILDTDTDQKYHDFSYYYERNSIIITKIFMFPIFIYILYNLFIMFLEPKTHFFHYTMIAYYSLFNSNTPLCPIVDKKTSNELLKYVVFVTGWSNGIDLMDAAISSVYSCTNLIPVIVWAGSETNNLDHFKNKYTNITIIQAFEETYNKYKNLDINFEQYKIGVLARYEIMNYFPDQKYLLYADTDTLFIRNINWDSLIQLESKHPLSLVYDSDLYDVRYNSGLFVMNTEEWKKHIHNFRKEMITPINKQIYKQNMDQDILISYLQNNINKEIPILPVQLNWKPYWGYSYILYNNVIVVHYHGSSKYKIVKKWLYSNIDDLQNYHNRAPSESEARSLALMECFLYKNTENDCRV